MRTSGSNVAAIRRTFSSRDQRRRRSTDVITSIWCFVIGLLLVFDLQPSARLSKAGPSPDGYRICDRSRLIESGDQLLQPLDPLILAVFTRLRRDPHRLQGSNIVGKIGGVQHG